MSTITCFSDLQIIGWIRFIIFSYREVDESSVILYANISKFYHLSYKRSHVWGGVSRYCHDCPTPLTCFCLLTWHLFYVLHLIVVLVGIIPYSVVNISLFVWISGLKLSCASLYLNAVLLHGPVFYLFL